MSGSSERLSHFAQTSMPEKQTTAPHISAMPTSRSRRSICALS